MSTQDENTMAVTVADAGATSMAMMNDGAMMDRMIKFAEIMATGKSTIPAELRNVGDCLAITMQAMAWKMMPQAVAQKCFFLNGRIGYEAQLVAAAINNSGATTGNFQFEWFGPWENVVGKFEIKRGDKGEYRMPGWKLADEEGIGIRVWATLRGEDSPRVLDLLLAQARTRNSTQWADDPKQQLAYLAQKKWARLYAPGVILGVYTPDELADPVEREINPMPTGTPKKPAELPAYPDADFAKNLDAWRDAIAAGKAKPEQIVSRSSSRYTLSANQIAAIYDLAKPAHIDGDGVIDAEFTKAYEGAEQK
jgi:hypothetical protein